MNVTGEQIRKRGRVLTAVGAGLLAWVVVVAALADVGNPPALVAMAVSAGFVCSCLVAAGLVATRINDAESAARLRHVFVVLEGAALAIAYLAYLSGCGTGVVDEAGEFVPWVMPVLAVPTGVSMLLVMWLSLVVHRFVVATGGPIVPDAGEGAPAQRIRVVGTVLVTTGVALSAAAVVVALTAPMFQGVYLPAGLVVTLCPVLLGRSLTRVQNVYAARRKNVGSYLFVACAAGVLVATFGFRGTVNGVLLGAVVFVAIVLVLAAALMMREYTGLWDRPWREGKRKVSR